MSERVVVAVQSQQDVNALTVDTRVLAATQGAPIRQAAELSAVVEELATNALRHGGGEALVSVAVGPAGWTVEVEDRGPGLSRKQSLGTGLMQVQQLSSRLELTNRRGGGARIVAHRDFPATS